MRQLTFVEPGRAEWQEVAEPRLDDGRDALVRPVAVTTCDIDHAFMQGGVPIPGPFPLGHEFVAEVTAVGADVQRVRAGQRVVVPFQISCGRCARCRRGHTACCTGVPFRSAFGLGPLGGLAWGGAFADLVRVPFADDMLVPLPDGVEPAAVAAASDNLSDAWRTVAPALLGDEAGADVLVVGGRAQSIGLYAVAIARALGAGRVAYADPEPRRLAIAERLGAEPVAGPYPRQAGDFPVTADCSADPEGLACALRSTAPWGHCTSVGVYFTDTPVPLWEMHSRGVRFVAGRPHTRTDLPAVLSAVAAGRLDPRPVTTGIHDWEAAPDVLRAGEMKPVFVRAGA